MTLGVWEFNAAQDSNGDVVIVDSPQVEVRRESDGTLASIFEDRAGSTPLVNPFTGDADGNIKFFADEAELYKITVSKSPLERTLRYQAVSFDAIRADLANTSDPAKGDALIGYKREATGAIARTLHAWLEDQAFNVKDFGATGDGTTDDTTAIQAAIDAAEAAGGGVVYFPRGTYRIDSELTIDSDGVELVGENREASQIHVQAADINGVNFDGGSDAASLSLCGIRHLSIYQMVDCTDEGKALLKIRGVFRFRAFDLFLNGTASNFAHTFVYAIGTSVYLEGIDANGGKTTGIKCEDRNDYFIHNCTIQMNNTVGAALFLLDVDGGAAMITNSAFLEGFRCRIENTSFATITNTYFDSAQDGVQILGGSQHVKFLNCEFANRPGSGVEIGDADGDTEFVQLMGCQIVNCGAQGVVIFDSIGTSVIGCDVDGNGTSTASFGVDVGGGVRRFRLCNNHIGNINFSGQQTIGIAINTGAGDDFIIQGNILDGNTSNGIVDNSTGANTVVADNITVN